VVKRLGALSKFGPSLAGGFAAAAARDPNRIGVVDETRQLTYGQLDHRVRRIAAGLGELGLGPGDKVAMLERNSIYTVETMVAASRAGLDLVLLNTFLSPNQLTEVLEREQPKAVVVDAELRENLLVVPEGTHVVIADPGDGAAGDDVSLDDLARSTMPDPAVPEKPGRLIILTSGTTGTPKGAKRGAPKGLGPAASMFSKIPVRAKEITFIVPPLFHTWGLGMLQLAPAINTTIVLRRRADPETILATVAEHHCTMLVVVPVMAQRMLEVPDEIRRKYDTSSLHVVACSSAALSADVGTRFQNTFGDILYNIYGATEVSWATIATPEDLRLSPGTAGRPPFGTKLALLNEKGKPVKLGEIGTIFVGNEMMFDGYTNGNDKLRSHGMISTGDKGVIDEHGLLMVMGRDDDMVISGGENVYPIEVEELLISHPDVRECIVIGVPDPDLGQRLAAYVVVVDGSPMTGEDVRDMVRARLAKFSIPRDVVFLESLPRSGVGKVVPRLLPSSTGV
jgi:acyl-CoA synthetase (AMP-forming)/AMP-acid ligase II